MTGTPAIRSELAPRSRVAIERARERLLAGGADALAAAIERWAADERRLDGRGRKTRSSDDAVAERRAVIAIEAEGVYEAGDGPLTSRGVAYRLEVRGLPKADPLFRRVEEDVLALRDSGLIAWETIADGSRRILRHGRFADAADALGWLAGTYERDLWAEADVQAQVWVGKAGIGEQLAGHAFALGLDVLPTRGFSGAGFIRAAVAECAADPRPLVAFVADDLDSSGARALETIERRVRRDAAALGVRIEKVEPFAVTVEQVEQLRLPTRPQKESTHRKPGDLEWAVELDAMPVAALRAALTEAVDRWCPPALRDAARAVEARERARLSELADEWSSR